MVIILLLVIYLIFKPGRFLSPKVNISPISDNFQQNRKNMIISSSAFMNGQAIPDIYGCRGQNINPPLEIKEAPPASKSLVLLVDDPDAPAGDWVHWLVWNINPKTIIIEADKAPSGAVEGINSFGRNRYGGPCPPSGVHHYQFKIYALDKTLNLAPSSGKAELLKAMAGHILDQAILVGTYAR